MERKIGEIFEYNGEWYQCVEGRCKDCHFSEKRYLCKQFIVKNFCLSGIIFKKLKKVGEPCKFQKRTIQTYKLYTEPFISFDMDFICTYLKGSNTIDIIIKQDKEDMEEKKLNLKPFDIQKAREGKPVCTRDGRKARIICFDAKFLKTGNIVTLVEKENGEEVALYHYDDGSCSIGKNYDLMMLPEKKEGWVNVYHDCDEYIITKDDNVYSSKDAAIASAKIIDKDKYVATVKIEWEE